MADNYYDTIQRMYSSSFILHSNKIYHNSCYLAGYVIEGYAKIIIGISYGFTHQELAEIYRHDINKLDKELNYILNHSSLTKYICNLKTSCPTILKGNSKWNPLKRYCGKKDEFTDADSINYQAEIQIIMKILADIKLNYTNLL